MTPTGRKWAKRLAVGAAILTVLLLAALFAFGRYVRAVVSPEDLQVLLNEAVGEATGGLYTVALEEIDWGSTGVSPRLHGISVTLDREVLATKDAAGELPDLLFQIQHATVDITGIDLWSLFRGHGFRAYALEIDKPLIQLSGLEDILARGRGGGSAGPAVVAAGSPAEAPVGEMAPIETVDIPAPRVEIATDPGSTPPQLRIWRVRLNSAALESYRRQDAATGDIRDTFELYESFSEVDIAFDDLDTSDADPSRLLFAADLRLTIGEYYYLWPDGLHEERHGPISLSTATGMLTIENFAMTPLFERRDRLAADGSAPVSRTVRIARAAIEGLDVDLLLAEKRLRLERISMRGFDVDIVGAAISVDDPETTRTGGVTAPLTELRPGAILTEVLTELPTIEVGRLTVLDAEFDYHVDRDGDRWVPPTAHHSVKNFDFDFENYRSGPGVVFDPARPLFADGWRMSAERVETRPGDGRHRAVMSNWRSTSADASLTVDSFTMSPMLDRRTAAAGGGEPGDHYEITTGPLELLGIDYGSLIGELDVNVATIRFERPRILAAVAESGAQPTPARPVVNERPPTEIIGSIVLGLPDVNIGAVVLADAVYEKTVDRVDGVWLETPVRRLLLDDVDLDFSTVAHVEGEPYDVNRPVLAETATASIGRFIAAPDDGFAELTLTGVTLSTGNHDVVVEGIHYGPVTTDRARLVERVQRESLVDVSTEQVTLQGSIAAAYLTTGEVVADRLEVRAPRVRVYETLNDPQPASPDAGPDNTAGLLDFLESSNIVRVGEVIVSEGVYERRQAARGYDWVEIPPPVETVQNLNVRVTGFDTDPTLGQRRLLLSEYVEITADELATPLGDSGSALTLTDLALSSDSDTLSVGGARLSTRASAGDNDFVFGAIELVNVPYGRLFRSLVEPRYRGTTPVIAAMTDKDLHLRIASLDGELDDGDRRLTVGMITGTAASGTLSVDGVSFGPSMADADPATVEVEVATDQYVFRTPGVEVGGVDFVRLGAAGVLDAASLDIETPYVALVQGLATADAAATEAVAPVPLPNRREGASLADNIQRALSGFPSVRIDEFRAHGFTVQELHAVDGDAARALTNVDLTIAGLDLRPDRSPLDAAGLLYASDIRIEMPAQRTWLDNTVYEVEFGPIALSTGGGSLDLGRVAYMPPFSPERFLQRTPIREGDRLEVNVGSLRLDAIDFAGVLATGGVTIGRVGLSDWSLQILSDKKKPRNPSPGIASYPHEAMQALPFRLTIDEIALENGAVRYSERHSEGTEPGHIWWDRLQGKLTNLSNDPARMTAETPAVLTVSTRMLDEAFMNLEWRLPLLEPGPTMSYTGEMGALTAARLTSILGPLEGMRITNGVVDQAFFNVDVQNSHATGEFTAIYHDLGIQLVDRNTGDSNLGKRLLSFAAGLVMPNNNRGDRGKPARVGEIDWIPAPEDPFFKIFWVAIRGGVLDLVLP
jgi:hypothetical protein